MVRAVDEEQFGRASSGPLTVRRTGEAFTAAVPRDQRRRAA